ncbi:DNA replication protein [Ruthenibacterium lactatiformans]|uniref:DNA replication protein n=4 Tax=Ruthenibacterium lactatiformans TaxID=1550024 RepID=A0A6L6LNS8_9FIRM|nr:DNA replication protein [Ruthenibacterium lactatiformans]MTS26386.1 DNA replication protein [Ruthenibacterium lactatiformans]MTS29906.1 DNA replication protein [Ruthenibacterium lactatiformans]MTS37050.1 DNA replication protein [Ruthenibacterium lactatiformans]MTS40814.1 DNA replication protein [Ruthenibacterium lactatiformans]
MVHQGLQNRARRNGRKRHGLEQRAGRRARRETQYSGRRAAARTACAGHAAGRENTMNRDELYRRAQSIVAGRRQRAVTAARAAAAQAAQIVPGLAALENGRTAAGIEAARLAAMGAERTAVDAALARAAQFDRERDALLAAHPDIAARLVPAYTCPICQDTGRDGGEVCECVHALVRQLRQQQVNASSPLSLCSFETFALEKYPDTLVPELGLTARQHMAQVLEYCKYYAAHFSPRESTSLYLFGSAGLGKTHLALSIANTVLQKGCDVVYVSAQNAFDAIERERFASGEGDTMATLQSAELLILDDLGTEYISPYVNSCLYSLVNTRVCRRLPTIYTSNIVNDADLQRRYTEKVVSRLLGSCETLCFCGTDIRLMDK